MASNFIADSSAVMISFLTSAVFKGVNLITNMYSLKDIVTLVTQLLLALLSVGYFGKVNPMHSLMLSLKQRSNLN